MSGKKITSLLFAALIAGCANNPVTHNNEPTPGDKPFAVSKSASVEREVVDPGDQRIAQEAGSINQFAVKMYLQLSKSTDGNIFFSPYSITSALGMTDAGAKGTTDEQIRSALQVTLPGEDFHAGINGLDQSLMSFSKSTDGLELNVINSIWVQNDFPLRISYLDLLSRHYDAGVNLLDFINAPDSSSVIINDWVSDQTNDRIKNLIPKGAITIDTRLVLTNAIYFLADWLYKFDPAKTDNQPFHREDGSSVSTPLMSIGGASHDSAMKFAYKDCSYSLQGVNYVAIDSSEKVLELPYKGERIVMDFILPSGSMNTYESKLSAEKLKTLLSQLDTIKIVPAVRIPRFQFSTPSISLKKAFQDLGMTIPFTDVADFSGICQTPLMIADILHKAFIKVDETGTEAAAATAVIMEINSAHPSPSFVADRPFIYLIRDTKTNTILFMGRVLDPTVTE